MATPTLEATHTEPGADPAGTPVNATVAEVIEARILGLSSEEAEATTPEEEGATLSEGDGGESEPVVEDTAGGEPDNNTPEQDSSAESDNAEGEEAPASQAQEEEFEFQPFDLTDGDESFAVESVDDIADWRRKAAAHDALGLNDDTRKALDISQERNEESKRFKAEADATLEDIRTRESALGHQADELKLENSLLKMEQERPVPILAPSDMDDENYDAKLHAWLTVDQPENLRKELAWETRKSSLSAEVVAQNTKRTEGVSEVYQEYMGDNSKISQSIRDTMKVADRKDGDAALAKIAAEGGVVTPTIARMFYQILELRARIANKDFEIEAAVVSTRKAVARAGKRSAEAPRQTTTPAKISVSPTERELWAGATSKERRKMLKEGTVTTRGI